MEEIKNYPALVDAIWKIVQGTPEDRERTDFLFSEQRIAEELGITYKWDSDPCAFGIAQALNDLVDMGYCKGRGSFNSHRWMRVSPSADCSDVLPSASFSTPPLPQMLPLRRRALQLIHEQAVRHEEGITFYTRVRMLHQEAIAALLPTTNEIDMYKASGEMIQAMSNLEEGRFIAGSILSGALTLRVTLKGACWLLVGQPLLKLSERATQLIAHPEVAEATKLLMSAYSEAESKAAQTLYIAIEKLENGVGGEKKLVELLGVPKARIGDLKQSLQPQRHATTNAISKLNHQQCLERTTDIIEGYMIQREQSK